MDADIPDIPDLSDADSADYYTNSSEHHSELIRFLRDSPKMRETAKGSIQAGLYAGGGAMAGSLIAGPIGGLIGGIGGSILGFFQGGDYDGAITAMLNLENGNRKKLLAEVGAVLTAAGATIHQLHKSNKFHETLCSFAEQENVRNGIWAACLKSIKSD